MNDVKTKLRKEAKERRRVLPRARRHKETTLITQRFLAYAPFELARVVAFYVATAEEVATAELMRQSWVMGKEVVVPKVVGSDLLFCRIVEGEKLVVGPHGIEEPSASGMQVSLDEIDLIVTPGVAFDRFGARIGYGGGYYDRLFAQYEGASVALAFGCQMYDHFPVDPWDKAVNCVITGEEL